MAPACGFWGYNLLSSSVQFNGVAAAAVEGSGPNYVYAAVPAGATSGPIAVTTPGGDEHHDRLIHGELTKDAELTNRTCNS